MERRLLGGKATNTVLAKLLHGTCPTCSQLLQGGQARCGTARGRPRGSLQLPYMSERMLVRARSCAHNVLILACSASGSCWQAVQGLPSTQSLSGHADPLFTLP